MACTSVTGKIPSASNSPGSLSQTSAALPPPGIAIPQVAVATGLQQFRPATTPIIPGLAPPAVVTPTLIAPMSAITANQQEAFRRAQEQAQVLKQQEELQKKLLEENEPQTLQQQENMSIKGQSARHLVMQKLHDKC